MSEKMTKDINNDGKIDTKDIHLDRYDSLKQMAWIALFGVLCFGGLLFLPIVPIDRIIAIGPFADLIFLSLASVIGFFAGKEVVNKFKRDE